MSVDGWLELIRNDRVLTRGGLNKRNVFHLKSVQTEIRLKRPLNPKTHFFLKERRTETH